MPTLRILLPLTLLAATLALHAQQTSPAGQPTLITINVDNAPIRDAFIQLERQTKLHFTRGNDSLDDAFITFHAQDKPLWEVVSAIVQQAAPAKPLDWTLSQPNANTIRITGQPSISGPFLITIQSITHEVDYRRRNDPEHLLLDLQIIADPSSRLASVGRTIRLDKAVDEAGNILTLIPPDLTRASARPLTPTNREGLVVSTNLQIPLQVPPNLGASLTLHGTLTANIATRTETAEIPIPGQIDKTYGDLQLTASTASPTPDTCTISFTFTRGPNMPDDQWNQLQFQLMSPRRAILDAHGNAWNGGGGGGSGNPTAITGNYTYSRRDPGPAGDAVKATLEFIAQTKPTDIPFHFENLPLR